MEAHKKRRQQIAQYVKARTGIDLRKINKSNKPNYPGHKDATFIYYWLCSATHFLEPIENAKYIHREHSNEYFYTKQYQPYDDRVFQIINEFEMQPLEYDIFVENKHLKDENTILKYKLIELYNQIAKLEEDGSILQRALPPKSA